MTSLLNLLTLIKLFFPSRVEDGPKRRLLMTRQKFHQTILLHAVLFFGILSGVTGLKPSQASTIFGTTPFPDNQLVSFDSEAPGVLTLFAAITGLQVNEEIFGLDFRPATGELYAVTNQSRLYTLDPATGAATLVGSGPFSPTIMGFGVGFDFNPVTDLIRVVDQGDQNFRLNPDDGTVVATDTSLNPAPAAMAGAAYTNNFPGATTTTLFDIDAGTTPDLLLMQGGVDGIPSPNNGTLTNIGNLGVSSSTSIGFDIEQGTGIAFAALELAPSPSGLFTIDLMTGAATLVGQIGPSPMQLMSLAVFLPPPTDLSITKTPVPNPTECGEDVVYTITITNNGPGAAENVVVTDPLATGLDFISMSTSQGACDPDAVNCDLGTVDPGTSVTITVTVVPTEEGDISNTATVSSTTLDPNPADNSATAILTVQGGICNGGMGGGGCGLATSSGGNFTPFLPALALIALIWKRKRN